MARFRNYQTNFSGGLLSEGMLGRVDLAQYENGCRQLTNWWPKVTGGMRRRPGSMYLNTVANGVRVESFIFSETQVYAVVFASDSNIYIYDVDDGSLIDTLTVTATWSESIIREMSVTQKGDVMFLAHESWVMQKITRTSATTFTLADFEFESKTNVTPGNYPKNMPFIKYAAGDVTISVNGFTSGSSVTVTASTAYFDTHHVGRAIRYRGKQLEVTALGAGTPPVTTCTATIREDLDVSCALSFNASNDTPSDFEIGEVLVGRTSGVRAQVIELGANFANVGMIGGRFAAASTEEVEGLSSGNIATLTNSSDTNPIASVDWDEEAFSDYRGWPSVIEFHSQRLWLGGSSSLPAHLFGSRVAAFFNFDAGDALAADSIQVAISGNQINLITDIVSGRHLQIFTDAGEFYAPESIDRPLVPESFDLLKQTRYGSKSSVPAKVFDESTLFVQAQGNAVREFLWNDNQRGYSSDAISLIAEEHLSGIVEMEILYGGYDRPEHVAFFINDDGTITWYHAARAEQIRTWGKWQTNGEYKSLTVIQDKLYALVERANGIFFERFELDVTLDCVVQSTAAATSIWNDVNPALDGETVHVTTSVVQANHDPDYFLGEYVYTGADVDLSPIEVDNVSIGLGFTQTLEPMPIEVQDQNGLSTGVPKRIVSADLYLASTLAASLQGNRIRTFLAQQDLSVRPTAVTGVRKFWLLGYSDRPTLLIENDIPVPCEVLSLGAEVEF